MAAAVGDSYEFSATGTLGSKRDTMLKNPLLIRNELGKPMSRGYSDYPGEVYRYGRPNQGKDGGAAEAIRGWAANSLPPLKKGSGGSGGDCRTERDFMALNKAAVVSGLTNASENYQFRATHDVRRKVKSEQGTKSSTKRLPPTQVYGISTRPSTPVHQLLEHHYQDQWLEERRSQEMTRRAKEDDKKGLKEGKVQGTRASQLRNHHVPVEEGPLWQMPKFASKAKPSLETFRSDSQKQAAFKMHTSDCISRKGVFGHGTYEQALT